MNEKEWTADKLNKFLELPIEKLVEQYGSIAGALEAIQAIETALTLTSHSIGINKTQKPYFKKRLETRRQELAESELEDILSETPLGTKAAQNEASGDGKQRDLNKCSERSNITVFTPETSYQRDQRGRMVLNGSTAINLRDLKDEIIICQNSVPTGRFHSLRDCVIMLPAVMSSLSLECCESCFVIATVKQLRLSQCADLQLAIACKTVPFLECCSKIKLAPWPFTQADPRSHIAQANGCDISWRIERVEVVGQLENHDERTDNTVYEICKIHNRSLEPLD